VRGPERLRIPEGTQPGSVFRMRGFGMPRVDDHGRGDLYVRVQVVIPSRLTREQRRLLEDLGATTYVENKPLIRQPSDRVKDGSA
jgi:molecular chaperone DnaJ